MRQQDPSSLRRVVEAVLEVAHCQTPDGRDAVLMLLPRDVSGAVRRMSTARMDTMSIVSTCARYPDGLTDLVEAIRFFADGSMAMARLEAVVAALSAEPD